MTRNHTASVPRLTLNTGVEQPAHGYGVFQAPPEQMGAAVQEALYIGYRHVDRAGLTPLFPFGFELSYTTFELEEPRLRAGTVAPGDEIAVTIPMRNTGERAGQTVIHEWTQTTTGSRRQG